MTSQQLLPMLLLLAALSPAVPRAYTMEQVESRPIDGHRFVEGQPFRFVCRAVGDSDLAVRMICPLINYAPDSIVADACFENCGRPLCNQPGLHDCSKSMIELKDANCVRTVSQLLDGSQEIIVQYLFTGATTRMGGSYACQYKNMRSSVLLTVEATTTASTTTSTSTTRTSTASTSASTIRASTTTPRITTAPISTSRSTGGATTSRTTGGPVRSTTPSVPVAPAGNDGPAGAHSNQGGRRAGEPGTAQPADRSDEVQLKSGWFYSSLVGKLVGIDIVLIVLLILLAIVLLAGFLLIRCQVAARQRANSEAAPTSTKPPLHQFCARLLCISVDDSDISGGGGASKTNGQYGLKQSPHNTKKNQHQQQQQQKQHQRLLKAPPIQPFHSGSDTASGQVYSEANLDSSYYSQGEASDIRDAEYRLQTHFDAADSRGYPIVSGSQRGPRVGPGVGFFNRDAPDRHSFHNVRASRQRPAIPEDLLMREGGAGGAGGVGAGQLSREEIRGQVEKQRREIDNLRQMLRDSQQQLSRLANSQQELHRSVSVTRMPVTASATTPEEPPAASPMDHGDYELLARAVTSNQPTVQVAGETQRSSADLLQLSIEEPIQEESEDPTVQESLESLQYPTVRSASKRRSSIGEAYATGRLCPA